MSIRYPVEINIHGELVDANGTVFAKDVVTGALEDVLKEIMSTKKSEVVNYNRFK